MMDQLNALLSAGAGKTAPFPPNSRYHGIETAQLSLPDGRTIVYLRRRFLPRISDLAFVEEQSVRDGDRPDILANRLIGDPEQFWRLCDANNILHPAELARPGRTIRVTLPFGFPGGPRG